jgi:UDP-3-O-[3-hydroxymyristoyl] glucosamine N-acyltransferase
MIDARFYESLGPFRLADLADRSGARLRSEDQGDVEISGVAALESAAAGDVGFVDGWRRFPALDGSGLSACYVSEDDAKRADGVRLPLLIAERPPEAFTLACQALVRVRQDDFGETGVHPSVELDDGAVLEAGARVARGARIGAGARIGPNAVIGGGVEIGAGSQIGPCAVVRFAMLGERVHVHAGAVIGESGYGLAEGEAGLIERPHLGRVLIGDDVRIGANTTIDRGMLVDTEIGAGTKIDNLVQVAHNVRIGRGCVIAGCAGISGSAVIEDGAMLGGSAGVSDHVRVGAGARLSGATLVIRDVPPGESWSGAPARPTRQFFREIVALEKLARRGPQS